MANKKGLGIYSLSDDEKKKNQTTSSSVQVAFEPYLKGATLLGMGTTL